MNVFMVIGKLVQGKQNKMEILPMVQVYTTHHERWGSLFRLGPYSRKESLFYDDAILKPKVKRQAFATKCKPATSLYSAYNYVKAYARQVVSCCGPTGKSMCKPVQGCKLMW